MTYYNEDSDCSKYVYMFTSKDDINQIADYCDESYCKKKKCNNKKHSRHIYHEVKIGITKNLDERLRTLRCSKRRGDFWATYECLNKSHTKVEGAIHSYLASRGCHGSGEWYYVNNMQAVYDLLSIIDNGEEFPTYTGISECQKTYMNDGYTHSYSYEMIRKSHIKEIDGDDIESGDDTEAEDDDEAYISAGDSDYSEIDSDYDFD